MSVIVTVEANVAFATVTPAITVFKAVPPTVIASASSVPSISASPETSNVVKSNSPAIVTLPSANVIKSVSSVCPIVVPLITTSSISANPAANVPVVVNPAAVIVPEVESFPLLIKNASSTLSVSPLKEIFVPADKFVSSLISIVPSVIACPLNER